jgi:hypothetical protein
MPVFLWRIWHLSFRAFHVSFRATRGLKILDFSASATSIARRKTIVLWSNFGCSWIFVALAGQHPETSSINIARFRLFHAILPLNPPWLYSIIGGWHQLIALFKYRYLIVSLC